MFGARVIAIANNQSAHAAETGFAVARSSEGPRRWWNRLFAAGADRDQPEIVKSLEPTGVTDSIDVRPRPIVRLDPARGIID